MALTPASSLLAYIDSATTSYTAGTNAFLGPPNAPGQTGIPVTCLFALDTGGEQPMPYLTGATRVDDVKSRVKLVLRYVKDAYSEGQAAAWALWNMCREIPAAGVSGYYNVEVLDGHPNYAGRDSDGNDLWTVNVNMWATVSS